MQLDERGEAKPEAGGIGLRECRAQELVQEKLRFEIGAGRGEFDFVDAIAQVQAFAMFAGRAEQAPQPPSEIRGLADVRLAIPAQEENGRRRGEFLKEALVFIFIFIWRECKCAVEHMVILEVIDLEVIDQVSVG